MNLTAYQEILQDAWHHISKKMQEFPHYVSPFLRYLFLKVCLQMLFLIFSKFKRINELLSTAKSLENLCFYDDFRGNKD